MFRAFTGLALLFGVWGLYSSYAVAADETGETVKLANEQLTFVAPKAWERKEPKNRIIEHEFALKAAEGDAAGGRITVMGAGGEVQANIDRWISQFSQPDGSDSKKKAKTEKKKIGGLDVHVVDITGTYADAPGGPFAGGKTIQREEYRMLGAIIVAPKIGNYFIKLYGPTKTVTAGEADFQKLLDTIKVVGN